VPGPAEAGQLGRADAALHRAQQQVAQLLGEAAGGQRRPERLRPGRRAGVQVAAEQVADHQVLLGSGQQPRRAFAAGRGLGSQHAERVRVERAGHRLPGGATQPGGDPLPQLGRGPAAEGQHQHRVQIHPAPADPVGHHLDQGGRLAGARPGQHQQRAARVVQHGALRRVWHESAGRPRGGSHQPVRRRPVVGHPGM